MAGGILLQCQMAGEKLTVSVKTSPASPMKLRIEKKTVEFRNKDSKGELNIYLKTDKAVI